MHKEGWTWKLRTTFTNRHMLCVGGCAYVHWHWRTFAVKNVVYFIVQEHISC